jgi:hypothetical protein
MWWLKSILDLQREQTKAIREHFEITKLLGFPLQSDALPLVQKACQPVMPFAASVTLPCPGVLLPSLQKTMPAKVVSVEKTKESFQGWF